MVYEGPNDGEGQHDTFIDVEVLQSQGYSIISPGDALSAGAYSVSINSGDLNATDTLTVGTDGDEALFDGSTVSLSSATDIGIAGVNTDPQGNEQFRFDVIYIDSSGEVQKTEGTPGTLAPFEEDNNLTRFERASQPIPEPTTWPAPVIAAVVVNSSDSSVGSEQLRDFRVPATVEAEQVNTSDLSTDSVSGSLTGGNSLTDITSSGLEIASNGLQILSSVWDAANSEIVADVNNTNTTTETLKSGTAKIGGGTQINQLEFGEVSLSGPGASSDETWGTAQIAEKTVTFDKSFDTEPTVVTGGYDPTTGGLVATLDNVTTTDFRILLYNYSTDDKSNSTFNLDWIAVE